MHRLSPTIFLPNKGLTEDIIKDDLENGCENDNTATNAPLKVCPVIEVEPSCDFNTEGLPEVIREGSKPTEGDFNPRFDHNR